MSNLRDMLEQDADSPEDVEALLPVLNVLQTWQTAPLDDTTKHQMTAHLQKALIAPKKPRRHTLKWARLILRSQVRMVQQEIWWASALMFALGGLVTMFFYTTTGTTLVLTMLAPVIAISGIALLYNAEIEEALEIERAMPVPLPVIILARLCLVLVFDTLLGAVVSLALTLVYPELAFWSLILSWFVPMTFLSALAFFVSVTTRDSATGIAISLALWLMYALWRFTRTSLIPIERGVILTESYPLLLGGTCVLLAAALWLTTQEKVRLR